MWRCSSRSQLLTLTGALKHWWHWQRVLPLIRQIFLTFQHLLLLKFTLAPQNKSTGSALRTPAMDLPTNIRPSLRRQALMQYHTDKLPEGVAPLYFFLVTTDLLWLTSFRTVVYFEQAASNEGRLHATQYRLAEISTPYHTLAQQTGLPPLVNRHDALTDSEGLCPCLQNFTII
jgi:hypothetical protein